VTLEPYQPLQLDISAPNVHTITEALLHLNEPETISGVYSASRGTNVDATKTVYLETVPPILTLHLKRFLYDPVENRVVKKGKAVAYGPELIIPTSIISPARRPAGGELRYRLFGGERHIMIALTDHELIGLPLQSFIITEARQQEDTTRHACSSKMGKVGCI
jgi:ubiquitin carboxyl-terminal hydrolase 10